MTSDTSETCGDGGEGMLSRLPQSRQVGDLPWEAAEDRFWNKAVEEPGAGTSTPGSGDGAASTRRRASRAVGDARELIVTTTVMTALRAAKLSLSKFERKKPWVMIVEVASPAWEGAVAEYFPAHPDAVQLQGNSVPRDRDAGTRDVVAALAKGRSVIAFAADPDRRLPKVLVGAADLKLKIPAPGPDVMRKVVARWTGRKTPVIEAADIAGLDLDELTAALRPGASPTECISRLRKAAVATRVSRASDDTPALVELAGFGAAKEWALELVEDVRRVRAGEIPATQLESAILYGPPGTGKTMLAKAVAKDAGLPFVMSSVAAWFENSPGYLDSVVKAAAAVFDRALASAPSLLFLDELDALPDRAKISRGADWWLPVLTSIFLKIDQCREARSGVVLMAATNHVDRLDAALRRPGRFDRSFLISPPDAEALVGILRTHLGRDLRDVDLLPFARGAAGATGAQVVQWLKQARRRAYVAKRAMALGDLHEVAMPDDGRSDAELMLAALHEAGHAVVARKLGIGVKSANIRLQGNAGGSAEIESALIPDLRRIEAHVVVALAGRASDIALGKGPNAGATGDLRMATKMMLDARVAFGLVDNLIYRDADDPIRLLSMDRALSAAVEADLRRLLDEALRIVRSERAAVMRVAEALVSRRMLVDVEIDQLIAKPPNPGGGGADAAGPDAPRDPKPLTG